VATGGICALAGALLGYGLARAVRARDAVIVTLVTEEGGFWLWEIAGRYETVPRQVGTALTRQQARTAALAAAQVRQAVGS
jgi:hypothetical protein